MVQRKNFDLTEEAIKQLSFQAIEKGYKNCKNYAEHVLEFVSVNPGLIKNKAKDKAKKK